MGWFSPALIFVHFYLKHKLTARRLAVYCKDSEYTFFNYFGNIFILIQ